MLELFHNISKIELACILLSINLVLKLKTLSTPIDFDTSSHIYFAFLKNHKVPFKSSYSLGIKWALPRLYTLFGKWLCDHPNRFRYLNIISSSIIIIQVIILDPTISQAEIIFYIIFVLLLNSLWVNFTTSAIEFHEPILFLLILIIPMYLPFYIGLLLQVSIVLFLLIGCKLPSAAYILPTVFSWGTKLPYFKIVILILAFCLVSFTAIILYKHMKLKSGVKTYSKSRKVFGIKNLRFILLNPFFIIILGVFFILNCRYADNLPFLVLQITCLIILIAQKTFTSYFFYPSLISIFLGSFFGNTFDHIIINYPQTGNFILLYLIFTHSFPFILLIPSYYTDICMRIIFLFNIRWKGYLDNRMVIVNWLEDNIEEGAKVYLWGSHVSLLLLPKLLNVSNTYYNHNHLLLWNSDDNKMEFTVKKLKQSKPGYIIESKPIGDFFFPVDNFKDNYVLVYDNNKTKVYKSYEKH